MTPGQHLLAEAGIPLGFMAQEPPKYLPHRFQGDPQNLLLATFDAMTYGIEKTIAERAVMETVHRFPQIEPDFRDFSWADANRFHLMCGMWMHAFFHEYFREVKGYKTVKEISDDAEPKVLPWPLSELIYRIAQITGRQPSMSYGLYSQWNWKFAGKGRNISLDAIDMLHTFTGTMDERWFVRIHQIIDYIFDMILAPLVDACLLSETEPCDIELIEALLWRILPRVQSLGDVLDRMREHCDPGTYFDRIRMFYTIPRAIIFEGVKELEGKPLDIPGETGGQDPGFHMLFAALGQPDTKYHEANRRQIEGPVQMLIGRLREHSRLRKLAIRFRINEHPKPQKTGVHMKLLYNGLTDATIEWSAIHLEHARRYIPRDTHGTHKIQIDFLEKLRDDRIACLIS